MKAKVKLNLSRLSVPEKIVKGNHIVVSITGNANFSTPHPSLLNVSAAITALSSAYNNAQSGGAGQTVIMHQKEEALDGLLTELGHYVEDIAQGNAAIILSSGMEVKSPKSAVGELPAPVNLTAGLGSQNGHIDLNCDSVKGAHSYVFQQSPDPVGAWVQIAIVTKSKHTVTGLQSGTRYWFRVASVGTAGQSDWSAPASGMSA